MSALNLLPYWALRVSVDKSLVAFNESVPVYQYTIDWGEESSKHAYLCKKLFYALMFLLFPNIDERKVKHAECLCDGTTIYSTDKDCFWKAKIPKEKFLE